MVSCEVKKGITKTMLKAFGYFYPFAFLLSNITK